VRVVHGGERFDKPAMVNASVEREIEEMWPVLKTIDWLAGRLDEEVAVFSMHTARDAAWQMALQYAALTPNEQQNFLSARDAKVAAFGKKIVEPGILLSGLISVLGVFERGSVVSKIEELNENQNQGIIFHPKMEVALSALLTTHPPFEPVRILSYTLFFHL